MADPLKRLRERRRAVLNAGLLACYEIIDGIRKELAELDAADKADADGVPVAGKDGPPSWRDRYTAAGVPVAHPTQPEQPR